MLARIKALQAGMILAGGLLVSSSALGLVLGNLSLSSALNEPLEATIQLDSLAGLEASSITVTLGDQAAYDRVAIERDPFLDSIQFAVEVDNANEGRIVLTSPDKVTEPFLNLIISVTEPGGVTLKEYTLLVELPTYSEAAPAETAPAVAGQPATAGTAPAAATYTIASGDTLWEIAAAARPDASVSVQQMIVAIQRANPDAFINNNINRLINGRVLRIPTLEDIRVIDQRAAVAQINQQNSELGGQPLAVGNNGGAGGAAADRDQLSVLTSDEAGLAGGSSDLDRTIAALENELMLSEESLDRARIENLELNNRLSSLQEQIDLLENIIAIEDERIAQLQAELTAQADATAAALASAQTSADAITQLNNQPASGLTGLLSNVVVALGAGVGLVLLLLGFFVYRRKQALVASEERAFNPALAAGSDELEDEQDEADEAEAEAKPGFLAGLLARFRRGSESVEDEDYEADTVAVLTEAPAAPQPAVKAPKNDADKLLDEMGISDEMLSLDEALNQVDSAPTGTAEVFEPVEAAEPETRAEAAVDALIAEAAADAAAAAQTQEADYAMAAADEAFAAIDSETAEPEVGDVDAGAASAPVEPTVEAPVPAATPRDAADTFEFKLREPPETESAAPPAAPAKQDIETFDFKLSTPVATPAAKPAAATPDAIEVVNFPGSKPAINEPADEEGLSLDLGDLSFDDTMVGEDNDEPGDYKPRTGNECDTKLDLATAYEAMGDVAEAIEILDEVIAEGSPAQVETAQRLKQTWQSA